MTPESATRYAEHLHRANSDWLGFIPRATMLKYAECGQLIVASENSDPCGYLIFGNGARHTRIYQACIDYDARRRAYGLALVRRAEQAAKYRGAQTVSLRCRDNNPAALEFWAVAGYAEVSRSPAGRRGNDVICMVRNIGGLFA